MKHLVPFVLLTCGLASGALTAQRAPSLPITGLDRPSVDGDPQRLDLPEADALRPLSVLTLRNVPLPSGRRVDLALERVRLATWDALVSVDGRLAPGLALEQDVTLWSGHVIGDPDSDVFLGISPAGSRGWIRTDDELVHLVPQTDTRGGTTAARLFSDAQLRAAGAALSFSCGLSDVRDLSPAPNASLQAELEAGAIAAAAASATFSGTGTPSPLPLLEARIAIETDTAFFELFGDLQAAQTYLVTLLGAVSHRFRDDVGLVLTVPYIGFHTGDDGWDTPDVGGSKLDMLFEFQARWGGGQAPVKADLFHFVSGAPLGGGVAFLGTVCNSDLGFGISGNQAGMTPAPITPNPLNYDYYILAHELGHNFGTPHTHDFCEPLDQCAPAPFFGSCQSEQICQVGTLMSYCSLCPGGQLNIQDSFHPVTIFFMRGFVEQYSCLRPYTGVVSRDAGFALAGAGGAPDFSVRDELPGGFVLQVRGAVPFATGALIASSDALPTPFLGGTLVPEPTKVLMVGADAAGELDLVARIPPGLSFPDGSLSWLQVWLSDASAPQGYAATNALELELIIADPLPDPQWIPHPSNGLEYALTSAGSLHDLRVEAHSQGAELASIDSQTLNDWLLMTFQDSGPLAVFIGLNDLRQEGSFVWFDNSPLSYTHWGTNQPNNLNPSGQQAVEFTLQQGGFEDDQLEPGEWNDWTEGGWITHRALMQRP